MEKHDSQEISQPSDLFGLEILPECTFESEYGKLTLGHVIVPNFSSDEKGSIRLKEEFENLKSFIKEKDPSRKGEISDKIFENEFSAMNYDGELILSNSASRSSETFSEFINYLKASMRARLFEMGVSIDNRLCREFGYSNGASLSSGEVHYNGVPVVQPLSCAGGVYAYCLKYALNPDIFCPPDYYDLKNEIIAEGVPKNNYLSWAFNNASDNEGMLSLVSDVHFWLC